MAGHSMGGQIAQELALARPELVQTLMILSSCARIDERGKAVIEMWGELPRLVDAETAHRLSFPWIYTSSLYATSGAIERVVEGLLTESLEATATAMLGFLPRDLRP